MSEAKMLTVISYDIASPRTRRKVSEALEAVGVRVQRSVFEAMLTERQTGTVVREIEPLLAPEDTLRVYAVAAPGRARCHAVGGAPLLEDAGFYLL